MIADAPEPHVVPYTEACDKIGEGALQSLLSYNYLTLRTRSTFARDLPPEAFVGEKDVVTATHQAALNYIMTKAWQRWVRYHADPRQCLQIYVGDIQAPYLVQI